MAFNGLGGQNSILTILNGTSKYDVDISPRNITASGNITSVGTISVAAGDLVPLTVSEADGSPLNTQTQTIIFPNASVISSGNQVQVVFPTAASGLIFNPGASSTDNALVRWDGTSGAVIQDSNASLDDDGNLVLTSGLAVGTNATVGGTLGVTGNVTAADVSPNRVLLPQVTVNGTYQEIADSQHFVLVASGLSSIVLPPLPVVGQVHIIKDAGGLAGSSTITVLGSGANIDGVASVDLINNYASLGFMWGGTEWSAF